jgi:dihydrofolate reductase
MASTKFSIVVAVATENNAIGVENRLPWHIPKELAAFRTLTRAEGATNAVIMGRGTYESFPNGPLPGRTNIVLSRNPAFEAPPGVIVSRDLGSALKKLGVTTDKVFVIGGAQLYLEALLHPQCEAIYLTSVSGAPGTEKADAFFPDIPGDVYKIDVGYAKSGVVHSEASPITYEYKRYVRIHDE